MPSCVQREIFIENMYVCMNVHFFKLCNYVQTYFMDDPHFRIQITSNSMQNLFKFHQYKFIQRKSPHNLFSNEQWSPGFVNFFYVFYAELHLFATRSVLNYLRRILSMDIFELNSKVTTVICMLFWRSNKGL